MINEEILVETFLKLKEKYPNKTISRDFFISKSGISKRQINRIFGSYGDFTKHCLGGEKQESSKEEFSWNPETEKATFSQTDTKTATAESKSQNIRTLDDLLKVCNVDTTKWEVEKYVVNKWEVAAKDKNSLLVHSPLYQVKAWLRKVSPISLNDLKNTFLKSISEVPKRNFNYETPKFKPDSDQSLYVLNIHDLHLAKLACNLETGHGDWDIRIAEKAYRDAVDQLMEIAPKDKIEEVLLIVGSDFFQIDTLDSTTRKGTFVDSDTRITKAFDVGCNLMTSVIEKIASQFKVRLMVIAGNHDTMTAQFLGSYLKAWFRGHDNVFVDASLTNRKYYGYGKTLLSFTHGSDEKLNDLPLTIFRECQKIISDYEWIEVLTGHLHHEVMKDIKGVRVRISPALCPPDKWHANKAFVGSIQTAQGLLYSKEKGLKAIYYSDMLN